MNNRKKYGKKLFRVLEETSYKSANEIVPIVMELINPKSVVDVGCGLGGFLKVFMTHGVKEVLGIDGDWINKKDLLIPAKNFKAHNLNTPININKKFGLVVSLEVAEHLKSSFAETFINSLVKLGDIILFSAAIPYQKGLGHINEQWPDYWEKFFIKKNYIPLDIIRKKLWNNNNISWWYKQNILLYINRDLIRKGLIKNKILFKYLDRENISSEAIVHPERYLISVNELKIMKKVNSSLEEENMLLQREKASLQEEFQRKKYLLQEENALLHKKINETTNTSSYKLLVGIDNKLKKFPFLWKLCKNLLDKFVK